MISYDSYQNRIKRIAAIKNFIVRFRLLFIALAVLIIATIFTLLGITGIVTKDITLPSNPVYGEAFTVEEPKALLSGADYQFRYLGKPQTGAKNKSSVRVSLTADENSEQAGEWTYDTPTLAGRYEVRVVTKSGFGGKKYGTPKQFEIQSKPVEFIIKADSIKYGSSPSRGNYEFELVSGDTLSVEDLTFNYDDPSLDITNICANSSSFVILNSRGEDVTFCYDISTPKKEVSLEEKTISLSLENVSREYSGQAVDYKPVLSENTVSALKGDEIRFNTVINDINGTAVEKPVNAGVYTVSILPEVSIFNGTADVSKHYKIERTLQATLIIKPRKITITTASDSKEYDGTALINNGFDTDGGLIEGHKVSSLSSTVDKTNAGEYENFATFAISDADGNDVTNNYEINNVYGKLIIAKREITVKTSDRTKIYDGKDLSERDFNDYALIKDGADALATNHTQTLFYANSITDAQNAPNEIAIKVYDGSENDVTSNYAINYVNGTLTVNKREITITTPSDSWVYDGYAHTNSEITVKLTDGSDGNPFADGEELSIIEATAVTYFTEGAVQNVVSCEIIRSADYSDATNNYKITTVCGELSITKRAVTITTPTITKVFDSVYLRGSDGEILADKLAETDTILTDWYVNDVVSFKYVGKKTNTSQFQIFDFSKQWDYSDKAERDEAERTANYEITYIYGELEITKRDITIHTPTVSKTYDGTPLRGDSVAPIIDNFEDNYGLPLGSIRKYEVAELTTAGTIENTTKYKIIVDYIPEPVNVDETDNYNITYDYGTIKVNKRYVGIATASGSKEYDGTPFVLAEGEEISLPFSQPDGGDVEFPANATGLLSGHTLKLDETVPPASVTNVDENEVINAVYFKIFDGDEDVSENYAPLYSFGKISIDKRNILVITQNGEFVYGDTGFSNPSTYSAHVSLVDGEWVEDGKTAYVLDHKLSCVNPFITPTEVGEYDNVSEYAVIDGEDRDMTVNYDLHIEYGKLKVTPRPLKITVEGGSRVYDDTPYTYVNGAAEAFDAENNVGIVEGHKIVHDESKLTASVTYVTEGQVANEQYYSVFKDETDVSQNYEITYEYGYIFVTARPITIQTLSGSKEFDCQPYSLASENSAEVISTGSLADGHYLEALTYSSVTYVTEGDVDNKVTYAVKKNDVDLTENYEITYDKNYGKISITKRNVRVLTNSRTDLNSFIYNGGEQYDCGYTANHLVGGEVVEEDLALVLDHKLSAVEFITIKNVAQSPETNICSYTVVTSDGAKDMSGNYELDVKYGTLEMLPRPVTITTATPDSHHYDAEPFSCTEGWKVDGGLDLNGVQLETGLVLNHTLLVKLDEKGNEIKTTVTEVQYDEDGKVTGVPNIVEYEVFDGVDFVTANYAITYKYGTLRLDPRPIWIETGSASKVYDGTPLYCEDFIVRQTSAPMGLLTDKNHTVVPDESVPLEYINYIYVAADGSSIGIIESVKPEVNTTISFITYITVKNNKLANAVLNDRAFKILDEDKNDVSKNYNIAIIRGRLKIEERPLTLTTPTLSKPYDGTELYGDSSQPVFGNLVTVDGIKESYQVVGGTVSSIIDVKESGKLNTTEYEIRSVDGKTETTLCYNITRVDGTLSITRIPLKITTITADKVYDGTPLNGDDEAYGKPVFDGFVEGVDNGYNTYYVPKNITSITDYGTSTNTTEYIIRTYRGDALTDITDNYGDENGSYITYIHGTLTVSKRTVKIFVVDAEHEYNGAEFTSTVWKEEEDTPYHLLSEFKHTLKVDSINAGITDVGNITNDVTYIVVDKDGKSVDNNYDLKCRYGTLTVTPRVIKIITPDGSWTYDAKEHFSDEAECVHIIDGERDETENGLVLDHALEMLTHTTITDFGEKPNVCTYKIVSKTSGDVTSNYLFDDNTYSYGTLSILKRHVEIETATDSREYDGSPFSRADGFKVEEFNEETGRGIVSGHSALVVDEANAPSVTYVHEGEIENILEFIIKDGETDVSGNYIIDPVYGKLSITAHKITVTNPTLTKPYDGAPLYGYDAEHNPEVVGLIENDRIEADFIAEITDKGTISNSTTYKIYSVDGALIYDGAGEVEDSYIIEYTENTTLSITGVALRITTASLEKIYDGKPLYGDVSKNGTETSVISALKVEHYDSETDSWVEGLIEGEYSVDENNLKTLTDVNSDTVLNTTKYLIFAMRGGELADITANYSEITYIYGSLNVKICKLIINTPSDSKEFDGTPLSNTEAFATSGDAVIEYSLAEGHQLKVKEGFAIPSVTYYTEGSVDNIIEYDIVDKDGNPVNENYFIVNSKYGKLSITQRKISIITASEKRYYNGVAQANAGYSASLLSGTGSAIVSGHSVVVDKPFTITNVSENLFENNRIVYKIIDGEKVDRTENYAIEYTYGTLNILPLPVEIVLNTVESFTYGTAFGGYPINSDGKMFTYANGSSHTVPDEELIITVGCQCGEIDVSEPVNAGDYEYVVKDMSIVGGNADIENYDVSFTPSSFKVYPKAITISLKEVAGKMYDGMEFEFPLTLDSGYEITEGELVEGDTLTIAVTYRQNGQFINNTLYPITEKNVFGNPVNAGGYVAVFDPENCTLDGGKPITNYAITCQTDRQSFNITQRPIYFDVKDVVLTYTSLEEYHAPDDVAMPDFDKTLLADGDSLENVRSGLTNPDGSYVTEWAVGVYETSVYSFIVKRGDNIVTNNYYLDNSDETKNKAKFEIVKRQIKLSVWFIDGGVGSTSSSYEYSGQEIDLNKLYAAQNGPYKSEVLNDEYNPDFGVGANDVSKVEPILSFTQGGVTVPLKERGTYEVEIVGLKNKDGFDVLKNYEIVSPSGKGEFTVTRRQVIVTPKVTAGNIEYNGKAIDENILDYDTVHKFNTSEYGFISDVDKNDYKATYSLYKTDDTSQDLINDILQVGVYKLAVNLVYIGTGEEKYDIVGYNYSAEFAVSPRKIYVKTFDDDNGGVGEYVYDKTNHADISAYNFVPYFRADGEWTTENVFCNNDASFATPVYAFIHENGGYNIEVINAGKYTIKVLSFTGTNPDGNVDISSNYQIVDFPAEEGDRTYGRITVRPAKVLIIPLPYSKEYDGNNVLTMPEDNYSIEYVEGNGNKLFGTDTISVKYSANVKVQIGSMPVNISAVNAIYQDAVSDGIENYEFIYSYSKLSSRLPEFKDAYSFESFMVDLAFIQRSIKILQVAPPSEYRQIEYGSFVNIKMGGVNLGDYVLSDGKGLIDGHRISVGTVFISADSIGPIKNWLTADFITIKDASNSDVTNGYKIEVVYDGYEDTYIEVVPREIHVEVNFSPSEIEDGSTLNKTAYSIVQGSLIYGDKMTVKVIDGNFIAEIADISGTEDNSDYYNVIFSYPETSDLLKEEAYVSRI